MNLHPNLSKVLEFLKTFGMEIRISNRSSSDSWNWDGTSIAQFGYDFKPYPPDSLLHEICHWIIASPTQREFPEFGLRPGIVDGGAWGPFGGEFRDLDGYIIWDTVSGYQDGILEMIEQFVQEYATQMLCIFLGNKFEIPVLWDGPENITTWEEYEDWKFQNEWSKDQEKYLKACSVFEEKVLLLK